MPIDKIKLSRPTFIMWGGISASGKTTFLNHTIGYIEDAFVIDKDVIKILF